MNMSGCSERWSWWRFQRQGPLSFDQYRLEFSQFALWGQISSKGQHSISNRSTPGQNAISIYMWSPDINRTYKFPAGTRMDPGQLQSHTHLHWHTGMFRSAHGWRMYILISFCWGWSQDWLHTCVGKGSKETKKWRDTFEMASKPPESGGQGSNVCMRIWYVLHLGRLAKRRTSSFSRTIA